MNVELWRNRISNRTDLVARVTHLTKGSSDEEAFEKLWKIIAEKKLIGSGNRGYVVGNEKAVCFQEVPLYSIVENLLFEDSLNDKTRYSWFGIRFNKLTMYKRGARPVIYGKTEELKQMLPPKEHWRVVDLDLESESVTDWSHEREWRIKGDFEFNYEDIEIIVRNDLYYRKFIDRCIENNKIDIIRNVHGIIPINTVIS